MGRWRLLIHKKDWLHKSTYQENWIHCKLICNQVISMIRKTKLPFITLAVLKLTCTQPNLWKHINLLLSHGKSSSIDNITINDTVSFDPVTIANTMNSHSTNTAGPPPHYNYQLSWTWRGSIDKFANWFAWNDQQVLQPYKIMSARFLDCSH